MNMKKMLSLLLAVLLVMTVMCTSAMAECHYDRKDQVRDAQMQVLYAMVNSANRQVVQLVRIAQATPYNDINWLQRSVARVVAPVFAYARLIGAQVECTYTTYYIDGQYVDVDPLRVINIT